MNHAVTLGTPNNVRRIFFILLIFILIATLGGIVVPTAMEYQARAALPPDQQTAEAIASIYDGAVCLGCDYGRIFLGMFGSLAFVTVLMGWGIYESVRRILVSRARPK